MSWLSGKTVLITGASSCSGNHLRQSLEREHRCHVYGTAYRNPLASGDPSCMSLDIKDFRATQAIVSRVEPDVVFHLAACSDANSPDQMIQTNVTGTWNLLTACAELSKSVRVLIVGSASVFGEMREDEIGLNETRPSAAASIYGITRNAQFDIGRLLHDKDKVNVYHCRTFNLVGPALSDRYAPAALVNRINACHQAKEKEVLVYNSQAVRDFIDVRDAVNAYATIIEKGRPCVPYSVGTGVPTTIADLAETIIEVLHADIRVQTKTDVNVTSRSQIQRSVADASLLIQHTGWSPKYSLVESVQAMLFSQLTPNS